MNIGKGSMNIGKGFVNMCTLHIPVIPTFRFMAFMGIDHTMQL